MATLWDGREDVRDVVSLFRCDTDGEIANDGSKRTFVDVFNSMNDRILCDV